jgi:hypothetical protein
VDEDESAIKLPKSRFYCFYVAICVVFDLLYVKCRYAETVRSDPSPVEVEIRLILVKVRNRNQYEKQTLKSL